MAKMVININKLLILLTIIGVSLLILFTNIVSVGNEGVILQFPNIAYLPNFLNSFLFVEIVFILFLFIFPVILFPKDKKRHRK